MIHDLRQLTETTGSFNQAGGLMGPFRAQPFQTETLANSGTSVHNDHQGVFHDNVGVLLTVTHRISCRSCGKTILKT